MFFYNKIKNKIIKEIIKRSKNPRPDSYPYISGDGFRKMANHIYDETGKFRPENVLENEIIFVKSDVLKEYFDNIHPLIKNKYKLISHNSDENITEEYIKYIDNKIIHWFAQNLMFEHEKVSVIPIGLENKHVYLHGIPKIFKDISRKKMKKKDRIIFGFNAETNTEIRRPALKYLKENILADKIEKLNIEGYLNKLNQYKYVASPPGNGVDCHRTWEAICLGVIPICLNNKNTQLFKKITNSIQSVESYKEISLENLVVEKNIVNFDYWKKIIENK